MSENRILSGLEARKKMLAGIEKLASAVGSTLGPSGRPACLFHPDHNFFIFSTDGVRVAASISLDDPFEALGANVVKETSAKTNSMAGDGTSTATILAAAIIRNGHKALESSMDAINVRDGIKHAADIIVEGLKERAVKVVTEQDILSVATISAHGDVAIGKIVSEAYSKVGRDGNVTVGESGKSYCELDFTNGMRFDGGLASRAFINNFKRLDCELTECAVLVTDKELSSVKFIQPILEDLHPKGIPLVIIAGFVKDELLATLSHNVTNAGLKAVAVNAPWAGDAKHQNLKDIAIAVGATFISEMEGRSIESVTTADLGYCERIQVSESSCTIANGAGKPEQVQARVELIRSSLMASTADEAIEELTGRLARLVGGIAIVRVGAKTESELNELRDRAVDAVHASKAAIEEGILPGGGAALAHASSLLDKAIQEHTGTSFGMGIKAVKDACLEPMRLIVSNAGGKPDVIIEKVLSNGDNGFGYDAKKHTFGQMIELGVIDPLKVTRCAFENAASISGLFLSLGTVVNTKKND